MGSYVSPVTLSTISPLLHELLVSGGSIIADDGSTIIRVAGDYGVGWNFLHMSSSGAVEYLDIQELIAYITGGGNRWVVAPSMLALLPLLSDATAMSHVAASSFNDSYNAPLASVSGVAELV